MKRKGRPCKRGFVGSLEIHKLRHLVEPKPQPKTVSKPTILRSFQEIATLQEAGANIGPWKEFPTK